MHTTVVNDFSSVDFTQFKLPMFVIYRNPIDFPDRFVVRLWDCEKPTRLAALCLTLEEARAVIPPFLTVKLPRSPKDEAQIVETWV